MYLMRVFFICGLAGALGVLASCAPNPSEAEPETRSQRPADMGSGGGPGHSGTDHGGFGGGMGGFGAEPQAAVPVEVVRAVRRSISEFLETNGVVEAENEVDVVVRTSGPIVELLVEEGMEVREGQLLARIDDRELRTQVEIATVGLAEAELAFDRAKVSFEGELISQEIFDQARSRLESARAQLRSYEIQLSYTRITAPFAGLIVERYIKNAQHLANGTRLFRISDFKPLLCPIRVPEKDLARLRLGQPAHLTVEAFSETRFAASVLRISPVVDAATGTVKVTLEVDAQGRLRPGMFASVFLETDRHTDALVVPRSALVLDSLGDTIYVASGGRASRREVRLGFREADLIEVLEGLSDGEQVVVLGQDSLSDGTPITVLASTGGGPSAAAAGPGRPEGATERPGAGGPPSGGHPGRGFAGPGGGPPDFSQMTPEQLEMMKDRMRSRGLSEEQIEERLRRFRERSSGDPPPRKPSPEGQK